MENQSVADQMAELAENGDLSALNDFVGQLNENDLIQFKGIIVDAYLSMYSYAYYDLACDKIQEEDREHFVEFLFEIISSLEMTYPDQMQYLLKADCYRYLSTLKTEASSQLLNIQKAINEYTLALANGGELTLHAPLAEALLTKMTMLEEFRDESFAEMLRLLKTAFSAYSRDVLNALLHTAFRIRELPFPENLKWHERFMEAANTPMADFAKHDPFLYLEWSDALTRIAEINEYNIPADHADQLKSRAIELLEHVKDYNVDDPERLNQLGRSFEKAANDPVTESKPEKWRLHTIAFDFFKKAHQVNPAAWTYTVYASNELLAMARMAHEEGNQSKMIGLFEEGLALFSSTFNYDQGFSLTIYWGDFLTAYARLVYNFKSPDLLQRAETAYLLAKEQGNGYYSTPFVGLARIALKSGNRQKCLNILQECKSVMSTTGYEYRFGNILEDPDFREIWAELG